MGCVGKCYQFCTENHSLGFLGEARLQERLKCQEGGAGCQKCVAAQPMVWREGWVEDRDSLPAARGMLQVGKPRRPWTEEGSVCPHSGRAFAAKGDG